MNNETLPQPTRPDTMDKTKIQHDGDELFQALLDCGSSITIEDAYQIQLRMIQRRMVKY